MKLDTVDTKVFFGGNSVDLGFPVEQALYFDQTIIVLLNYEAVKTRGLDANRNIVGLDKEGNEIWVIEKRRKDWQSSDQNPFVGVSKWEDGSLHAITWSGLHYVIDPKNGKLTRDQAYR